MRAVLVLFILILIGCPGGDKEMADTVGAEGESYSYGSMFPGEESYPEGAPPPEFNTETGRFETTLPSAVSSPTVVPPEPTEPPPAGWSGGDEMPKPQQKQKVASSKSKYRKGSGTESRKRRRSLLLEEEGGFLSPLSQAPVKRRSLFGT